MQNLFENSFIPGYGKQIKETTVEIVGKLLQIFD